MAVEDKYISPNAATKKENPARFSGGRLLCIATSFEQAAADSNESVYRLGKLPANAIPVKVDIFADAAIDGTDYDLGLYKPGVGGAVVDIDLFMDGKDLSAGNPITTAGGNIGIANLGGADPLANVGKKVWELLGLSAPTLHEYDLALTARVAGGAAGTIAVHFWYIEG